MLRRILFVALVLLSYAPVARSQGLIAKRIAVGLRHPCLALQAPGDDSRLFILERRNGLRIIKDGVINPGMFLDLSAELGVNEAITSLAFHPDYETNGRFFLSYMDLNMVAHLAEYSVSSDPDVADPNSRVQVLGPYQLADLSHNWNCLKFGSDGMLYFSMGDDFFGANSQDLSTPLGSILRMDIDIPAPHVPSSGNPFVGQSGVDELIWVYGLRQPWRFDLDPLNGDLYIADVGSGAEEEIDVVAAANAAGTNFGWQCLEGNICMGVGTCDSCSSSNYLPPVVTYPHTEGRCAVIGGIVYRGSAIPSLYGTYWYSDFCTGKIFSFVWDGSQATQHVDRTAQLIPSAGGPVDFVAGFGRDNAGEMYICSNAGGEIYKIVPDACSVVSYCSSTPNSAGTSAVIGSTGVPSIVPLDFEVNVTGVLPNKIGLFFYGPSQVQIPFGDGLRCVGGSIKRMDPPSISNAQGYNARDVLLGVSGLQAGDTANFQYWYRDAASANAFNFSNGLEVTICPTSGQ